jgi:hypothetical protein
MDDRGAKFHCLCQHESPLAPRNAYKYMLDKVVSPIACVNMNHQNQLKQMANGAMIATISPFLVIYDNTRKASINLQKIDKIRITYTCLDAYHHPNSPRSTFPLFDLLFLCSHSPPLVSYP